MDMLDPAYHKTDAILIKAFHQTAYGPGQVTQMAGIPAHELKLRMMSS